MQTDASISTKRAKITTVSQVNVTGEGNDQFSPLPNNQAGWSLRLGGYRVSERYLEMNFHRNGLRVQYLLIGPLVGQFNSPVSIDIGERVKYVGQWSRLNVGGFFIIQVVNEWASNWSFVDYIR